MSRYFFLSLCMLVSAAHADEKTTANDAHDLAYSLGASLGQCCGGRVRLLIEHLDPAALDWLHDAEPGRMLVTTLAQGAVQPAGGGVRGRGGGGHSGAHGDQMSEAFTRGSITA